MCTICSTFRPYTPDCDYTELTNPGWQNSIDETTNPTILGDLTSAETVALGQIISETLETPGDTHWYEITLEAGQWYAITLRGVDHDDSNGLPELPNPFVRLRDSDGVVVAEDDNGGVGTNALLQVQVASSGTYFIEVDTSTFNDTPGDYRLRINPVTPPSPVTAVQGFNWLDDSDPILVYFAQAGDIYNDFGDLYMATGTNAYEQGQIWSIFEGLEQFADIDFEITTNRQHADLQFATAILPTAFGSTDLGFFNFPDADGNGSFGILNNNSTFFPKWNTEPGGTLDAGGFMYSTVLHELGHGLGLGHPHDTGNGSTVMLGVENSENRGPFALNSAPFTVMSYTIGSVIAGETSDIAATGHAASFGALDIAALQAFYGVNTTHASSNDTYMLDDYNRVGSGAGYYTIWDTGGVDEIHYDGRKDAVIMLVDATLEYEFGGGGFLSYVDGVVGGRTIANGVVIENATGGEGDDRILGNEADNRLSGSGGADYIEGRSGQDVVLGGSGSDTLSGGADDDLVEGGNGNDTLEGGRGGDFLDGGKGDDTLLAGAGADMLEGGFGNDLLDGGNGNDILHGDGGNDILTGGSGSDIFVFTNNAGNDQIVDFNSTINREDIDLSDVTNITDYTDLQDNHMSVSGDHVIIDDGAGTVITLLNVNLATLGEADFIF